MVNRITGWLFLLLLPLGLWGQNIPEAQGFVNDFANLLSPQEETRLNAYLTRFAQETSNEIALVIIDLPEGYTPEDYTYELATQWGVGSNAERDNGLVLAVFPNASKVRIEVGYGLEGAIPDLLAYKIIREVISPQFRKGNYYQGLSEAIPLLADAAKGEFNEQDFNRRYYSQPQQRSSDGGGNGGIILIIIIVAFIILARRGGGGGKGGGGRGGRGGGSSWMFLPLFFPGGGWGGSSGGWGGGGGGFGGGGFGGGDFGGFGGGGFGGGGATGDW